MGQRETIFTLGIPPNFAIVATPAEPRGEKNNFFLCKIWAVKTFYGERKKTHKEQKHVNKISTWLSRDFGGDFVYVFFLPLRNDPKKTHKQNFGTHPVPGQSRKFVYVYVFFLSLSFDPQNCTVSL